jgi:RimJ/RimL family protein N-acetyltransferase
MIPTPTTGRRFLRAPEPRDVEPHAGLYASARSIWEDGPMPRAAASAEFAGSAETWGRRGFGNVRSIRLAERLGAVAEAGATTCSQDAGVWRHPGREALA